MFDLLLEFPASSLFQSTMANPLQSRVSTMTAAEFDRYSASLPSQKLDAPSKLLDEILAQKYLPSPIVQFSSFQQFRPQTALRHIKTKSRHLEKRSVPPKKPLNSWMAFRGVSLV